MIYLQNLHKVSILTIKYLFHCSLVGYVCIHRLMLGFSIFYLTAIATLKDMC
ncbi:hypothetical protein G3A81_004393 [Salmonella enterica subsp. enterica]|nr:hypothetical protein [Salmonella enterica subsp. enterica serovar Hillingdon]EDR1227201.1 hypothetical protein [Salmonella enterica subsp. enterica serovar Gateshead]EDS1378973.1 hypothetical protein [Salmonella enterica]EDS5119409.1 hypothetical protein [Salmonella enterica subsp. enterica serovar Agoueve]EDS5247887.1 hypothetical protein [Salmonella enterica subsp. enterica serovar Essen]EDT8873913.1 hypothetical protein [Salmonella enterica subsp. enterica]EEG4795263.1 hypothetical prot